MKIRVKIFLQLLLWLCLDNMLQDVAAGINPNSHMTDSVSDANLMFEFLLGGLEIDRDNNIAMLDKEMASMRAGRTFQSQINDNIPRSLRSMTQMLNTLEKTRRPLTQKQFDNLVMSMVSSAHRASHQREEKEQEAWGGVLLQLANVTVHELRGSYLFNYA